jgi:hypothetical protein
MNHAPVIDNLKAKQRRAAYDDVQPHIDDREIYILKNTFK